jgi:hypothetical protein
MRDGQTDEKFKNVYLFAKDSRRRLKSFLSQNLGRGEGLIRASVFNLKRPLFLYQYFVAFVVYFFGKGINIPLLYELSYESEKRALRFFMLYTLSEKFAYRSHCNTACFNRLS